LLCYVLFFGSTNFFFGSTKIDVICKILPHSGPIQWARGGSLSKAPPFALRPGLVSGFGPIFICFCFGLSGQFIFESRCRGPIFFALSPTQIVSLFFGFFSWIWVRGVKDPSVVSFYGGLFIK